MQRPGTTPETGQPQRQRAHSAAVYRRRRLLVFGGAALVVTLIVILWASLGSARGEPAQSASSVAQEAPEAEVTTVPDPGSLHVIVNKRNPLPADYEPADLVMPEGIANTNGQPVRAEVADALQRMYADADVAGVPFLIVSAYRSFEMQESLFDRQVVTDGRAQAEKYSARAGYSEHQTGLAVDLDDGQGCGLSECFGESEGGLWLRENSWKYGFILRYDKDQEEIVGFHYEPWHFRYVGVEVATAIHEAGNITLEEHLGSPAAPSY